MIQFLILILLLGCDNNTDVCDTNDKLSLDQLLGMRLRKD